MRNPGVEFVVRLLQVEAQTFGGGALSVTSAPSAAAEALYFLLLVGVDTFSDELADEVRAALRDGVELLLVHNGSEGAPPSDATRL